MNSFESFGNAAGNTPNVNEQPENQKTWLEEDTERLQKLRTDERNENLKKIEAMRQEMERKRGNTSNNNPQNILH